MDELKPCPFCGGKEVKLFKEGGIWVVECLQCLAKVGATLGADAIDFWNYRPREEQLGDQIREMELKNRALKQEIRDARDETLKNALKIQEQAERGAKYAKKENARILELLKSCCNEFAPRNSTYPVCCRNEWGVDAQGHCLGRGECPIYAELTKGGAE